MASLRNDKKEFVIQEFITLIRTNINYETNYLYQEAGKKAFMSGKRAGDIVRDYYKDLVTENPEMAVFVEQNLQDIKREDFIQLFAEKFSLVPREARHVIRQIKAMSVY